MLFADSSATRSQVGDWLAALFVHRSHWSVALWLLAPLLQAVTRTHARHTQLRSSPLSSSSTSSGDRAIFDLSSMALLLRDAHLDARAEFRPVVALLRCALS